MPDNGFELDRRDFLKVTATGVAASQAGCLSADDTGPASLLIGPDANKPAPGGDFFDNKTSYRYLYFATDTGVRYEIATDDSTWTAAAFGGGNDTRPVDELPVGGVAAAFDNSSEEFILRARPGSDEGYEARVGGTRVLGSIPTSVVHQYVTGDFTTSKWPDDVGSSDVSNINGLTFDQNAFGGAGGVAGDGVDDYGKSDTMGSFGQDMTTPHALAFRFSTTDKGNVLFGSGSGSNPQFFLIGPTGFENTDDTKLGYLLRDLDSNRNIVQTTTTVTDGGDYSVIMQRESNGGDASDMRIYVNSASNPEQDIVHNEAFGNVQNFTRDMGYFGRNRTGTPDFNINATLREPMWFNDSLSKSERSDVFKKL